MFGSSRWLKRLNAAVLVAGGAMLLFLGIWWGWFNADFIRDAERAPGEVVELIARRSAKGMTLYYPVVRYRPGADAAPVDFTARPGLWPSPFEVGDGVSVAYRPGAPAEAMIVSFWMLWFLPAASILLGLACLYAGRDVARKAG
jgi:hypothetical protein